MTFDRVIPKNIGVRLRRSVDLRSGCRGTKSNKPLAAGGPTGGAHTTPQARIADPPQSSTPALSTSGFHLQPLVPKQLREGPKLLSMTRRKRRTGHASLMSPRAGYAPGFVSSRNAPERRSGPFRHIAAKFNKPIINNIHFVCLQCLHSFLANYFASGFT